MAAGAVAEAGAQQAGDMMQVATLLYQSKSQYGNHILGVALNLTIPFFPRSLIEKALTAMCCISCNLP